MQCWVYKRFKVSKTAFNVSLDKNEHVTLAVQGEAHCKDSFVTFAGVQL